LLAALEEIDNGGGDGLAGLGLDFGSTPDVTEGNGSANGHSTIEAEEVPEVDTPLDAD